MPIPGHYSWTFDDPIFRIVLQRGIAWSSQESVDRLNFSTLFGTTSESPDAQMYIIFGYQFGTRAGPSVRGPVSTIAN